MIVCIYDKNNKNKLTELWSCAPIHWIQNDMTILGYEFVPVLPLMYRSTEGKPKPNQMDHVTVSKYFNRTVDAGTSVMGSSIELIYLL